MGLLDWVDVPYKEKNLPSIKGQGTQLIKTKRKKTRRGSGIKKKTSRQVERNKDIELYKKQKK